MAGAPQSQLHAHSGPRKAPPVARGPLARPELAAVQQIEPSAWCGSKRKRAMDITCGLVALPVVVPLTLALSLVSAVVFRCNPLFVQPRRGIHESRFAVFKIRSMPPTFEGNRGKHEIHHHEFDGWSRFLRNTHLDELPQLLNIIGGSMSVVGPRPMIDEVVDTLESADRATRAMVTPGLTGAWQVSTMGSVALHDHPELDNQYVANASFRTDLRIILMTAATVFGRRPPEPEIVSKRLGW